MDSLKRAEEIAKFLRQQTDFWMDQVRQIEQAHSHQPVTTGAAAIDPGSFLSSVAGIPIAAGGIDPGSFLSSLAGISLAAGASAAIAAVAASSSTAGATQPSSMGPETGTSNPTAGGSGSANDPMAELRRVQKEQWERKRTSSSVHLEAT